MMTRWPAEAGRTIPTRGGRIAPGYLADFTVFPRDPRPLPPDELAEMLPSMTIVGGEVAWRDSSGRLAMVRVDDMIDIHAHYLPESVLARAAEGLLPVRFPAGSADSGVSLRSFPSGPASSHGPGSPDPMDGRTWNRLAGSVSMDGRGPAMTSRAVTLGAGAGP